MAIDSAKRKGRQTNQYYRNMDHFILMKNMLRKTAANVLLTCDDSIIVNFCFVPSWFKFLFLFTGYTNENRTRKLRIYYLRAFSLCLSIRKHWPVLANTEYDDFL